jgi:hypothetical protein
MRISARHHRLHRNNGTGGRMLLYLQPAAVLAGLLSGMLAHQCTLWWQALCNSLIMRLLPCICALMQGLVAVLILQILFGQQSRGFPAVVQCM